jgi:hypothetical protein
MDLLKILCLYLHSGVFIEEGTTNLITNPSFEHGTYNTNWSSNYMNYATASATFTPNMSKRNSAGPFTAGPILQGKIDSSGTPDTLSVSRGTLIGSNFYSNFDPNQGSVVFWITPEWNGNDGLTHYILGLPNNQVDIFKDTDNKLYIWLQGGQSLTVDISSWTAGTTYNVVARWDSTNKINGTNYASISINNVTTFGTTNATTLVMYNTNFNIGSSASSSFPVNAIIEGLTIYRRVLYDGTYGTNVGNGNEISLIYNSGTGKDPTLITGSWDVVFALPTNASTGSLTTGTGNAWSHPHSSNLLYTSTSNTGGFMMGSNSSSDGFSSVNSSLTNNLVGYWTLDEATGTRI